MSITNSILKQLVDFGFEIEMSVFNAIIEAELALQNIVDCLDTGECDVRFEIAITRIQRPDA